MFCRMYEFCVENKLQPSGLSGKGECKKIDGKCIYCCSKKAIPLTEHMFDWVLCNHIKFGPELKLTKIFDFATYGIGLIHPTFDDLWLIQKSDSKYLVLCNGKCQECTNIQTMNEFIRRNYNYDGRMILETDFKWEEDVNVSN